MQLKCDGSIPGWAALFLAGTMAWAGDIAAGSAVRTTDGFALPQPGRSFVFPRDHGSHPEFKIEWWYITGHLLGADDRRFGFQGTFFRRAAPRGNPSPEAPSPDSRSVATNGPSLFGRDQVYLAHMALLDVASGRFFHQERLNREGWNAGAATHTLDLFNGNWRLRLADPARPQMQLEGSIEGEIQFSLALQPAKPLVVFGANGLSRKAADPAASSYYLTFSRLDVRGTLRLGTGSQAVQGQAWMDHEISSSQLGEGQVGWDWACLQLQDGREIMAYRMRRQDGVTDPYSTLAWVTRDGQVVHQDASRFQWIPRGAWRSPHTRADYPLPVDLATVDPDTGQTVTFRLSPLASDQELTGKVGGIAYWEGACRVLNSSGQEIGKAFMELTGYAGDLSRRFR